MGKRLIVAEKPSVGRDIANVLNCKQNGDGCRVGEHDIVTWAVGHLVGLCYPDEMDEKYADWKLEDLPIFPEPFQLKVLESSKKQYEIVKGLMNDPEVDRIVCATDAGREGELIFRYIYQMVGCSKPVDRLWISSLTFRAIKEGLENLKPDSEYDDLYQSARCRSEADWLIGMNGSRAYAIVNDMRRLSVGRVLSPTLAILVRRELERRNFVPEKYCEVVASFDGFDAKMVNESKDGTAEWSHFPADEKAGLEEFAKHHSAAGIVTFTEENEENEPPQQLYDLTSLQRDANRIYGMSSKWTLDTAQSLYERHKAITYPRTDSRYLSTDIKATLSKRLESLQNGELGPFAKLAVGMMGQRNLGGRFILNKGVSDHHAIIPTGEAKGMETWTKQEKQIFDLICRRFIAMFYPDRDVIRQVVDVKLDGRTFHASGEKEINTGWRMVDTSRISTARELPELAPDSSVAVESVRVRTDETKPPAPHTEASLLAAMEHAGKIVPEDYDGNSTDAMEKEFGIGTPATRAATIEKMLEKEMAVRKGRALIPTEYGIKLISILPEILRSPEMTGTWEAKLEHISKGAGSPDEFMDGIRTLTKEVVGYAVELGNTGIKNDRYVGMCPLCGNPVREYDTAYYCINKTCGFRKIYKAVRGFHPTLDSAVMRELLKEKVAETRKGTFRLIQEPPYIAFERASGPVPDYARLKELIDEYGVEIVDKVPAGGGMWFAGNRHDEIAKDFIRECENIGCPFIYHDDSKALHHQSGWCHSVYSKYKKAYGKAFGIVIDEIPDSDSGIKEVATLGAEVPETTDPMPDVLKRDVLDVIRQSGFEFVDKRPKGGSIWFVAGEEEGKELAEKCRELGVTFSFAPNGGRATKKRPAWYSKK